jgi:hypothetical protein
MLGKITLTLVLAIAAIATVPASAKPSADQCRPWDREYHWIC